MIVRQHTPTMRALGAWLRDFRIWGARCNVIRWGYRCGIVESCFVCRGDRSTFPRLV